MPSDLDDNRDIARHHQIALAIAGKMAVADLHHTIEIDSIADCIGDLPRPDMECAHCELRARSPIDCSDDTDGSPMFTGVLRARSRP